MVVGGMALWFVATWYIKYPHRVLQYYIRLQRPSGTPGAAAARPGPRLRSSSDPAHPGCVSLLPHVGGPADGGAPRRGVADPGTDPASHRGG
ncbi:hypothetical protein EYF80_057413 [Liparis tanakae]|uniref:Uncharacterized protein n=1 Tax=Liparis tanakae TaxID=230148 RepID=A0A4Z2EUF8_9TELE|nr:hypothetical protein EYF80_057413 [Liparis tanakae]